MKDSIITTVRFSEAGFEKFKALSKQFEITQGELIDCLVMQDEGAIQFAINSRLEELRLSKKADKNERMQAKRKIKDVLAKLTPEQLEALVNDSK